MSSVLLQRLMQAVVLLLIVSMIGFAILHLAPGGPMSQFADQVRAQERRIQLALGDDSVTSNAPRRRAADAAGRRTDRRSEKRRDGRRESGGRR